MKTKVLLAVAALHARRSWWPGMRPHIPKKM